MGKCQHIYKPLKVWLVDKVNIEHKQDSLRQNLCIRNNEHKNLSFNMVDLWNGS